MKVLLRSDVAGVGRRGDIVTVASGHARNFLMPRGLAVPASDGTVRQSESMQRARQLREVADRESAQAIATQLASRSITVSAKAGNEGRLFGSVTPADVVSAVAAQTGLTIDRKGIVIAEPIRTVGEHQVAVELFPGVTGTVTLSVTAE
jgi:large subunit ribosomal protein L9